MGTDLTLRSGDPLELARAMYASGLFSDTKTEAQAVVKVMAGQEYGLGPFAAMRGIHIFQGQAAPSAHVLAGAVKRHPLYRFKRREHTNAKCVIEFFERDDPGSPWESVGVEEYTMDDAKRAGLTGRPNWQKFPRNMLFARCLSNGVRFHAPDVTGGPVLVAEELADDAGEEFNSGGAPEPAAPAAVPNEAEPEKPSAEAVEKIIALYEASGCVEPENEDPHRLLRMQLAAVGAGNAGEPRECFERLDKTQFEATWKFLQDGTA